jgi:hypothetical protein
MKRWALIVGNSVDNIVEQESTPTIPGNWVECTGQSVGSGDTYSGGIFSKYVNPTSNHITVLAFLNRFTDAEAISMDLASIGNTVPAATLRRYMQKVNAAKYIDLARQDTIDGVNALETAGIIASGRASEILNSPIQDIERP